jgi:hypothetical protein
MQAIPIKRERDDTMTAIVPQQDDDDIEGNNAEGDNVDGNNVEGDNTTNDETMMTNSVCVCVFLNHCLYAFIYCS